jgi:hypothetical protein
MTLATTTEIPTTITPEAMALVQALGLEVELETMLEHTRKTVPQLHAIQVDRYDHPEDPDDSRVMIAAWQNGPSPISPTDWENWMSWFIEAFPPTVGQHFGFRAYGWEP